MTIKGYYYYYYYYIFSYLREAFREKRSPAQLLQTFYTRKQLEGEDLRAYSHALLQILNSVLKQSPDAIANVNITLRDQFIEGGKRCYTQEGAS